MLLPKFHLTLAEPVTFFAKQEKNSFIFGGLSRETQKLNILSQPSAANFGVILFENDVIKANLSGDILLVLRRKGEIHVLGDSSKKQVLSGKILTEDEFILCQKNSFGLIEHLINNEAFEEAAKKMVKKTNALFIKFEEKNGTPIASNFNERTSFFSKIIPKVKSLIIKINLKILKVAGVVIGALIIIFILFNIISSLIKQSSQKVSAEMKKIEEIKNKLENAKELLDLNNVRSREIAASALSEINKTDLSSLASANNKKQLEDLKKSLEKVISDSSNIVKSKAVKVYSTTILKKDSTASKINVNGNQISILDLKQNLVYSIDLSSKKAEIYDLDKYTKSSKLITSTPDYIYVFSTESILQIDIAGNKIKTVIQNPSDWKNIVEVAEYSGNIYLLDSSKNQVWKNIKDDAGFSPSKPYFENESTLKSVKSFAIDMAVYIISGSSVNKYLSGAKENFSLDKIPATSLKNPTKIVTSADLENLYLLEPSNKRIVVFDKKGKYLQQIVDNRLEFAGDFGVNEKDKEIYFANGADIYKISF